jgi:hypothetical protein
VVQLDDHAGGVSTQNVQVTVVGTNDKPIYLSGPESAHLIEDQNVDSSGNLTAHGDLFFTDIDLSDTHLNHRHCGAFGRRLDPADERRQARAR